MKRPTYSAPTNEQTLEGEVQHSRTGQESTERQEPREESVSQLFGFVQRLVEDERARGQAIETKAATLAGFTGTILAITAAFGRDFVDLALGGVGETLARVLFLVALLALGTGATLAIAGILRPQARLAIARSEIKKFSRPPLITTPPMELQGRMMNMLIEALGVEREVNDRKAKLSRYAAVAVVVGLVGIIGEGFTIVVATAG